MSDVNNYCPHCGGRTFSFSKRRGTYRCSLCGYENTSKEAVASVLFYSDALDMLPMDTPVMLNINEQASLRVLINKMNSQANDLAARLEAKTISR